MSPSNSLQSLNTYDISQEEDLQTHQMRQLNLQLDQQLRNQQLVNQQMMNQQILTQHSNPVFTSNQSPQDLPPHPNQPQSQSQQPQTQIPPNFPFLFTKQPSESDLMRQKVYSLGL